MNIILENPKAFNESYVGVRTACTVEEQKMVELLEKELEEFVDYHAGQAHPVVLITSGGTIVPLEKNMVRYIDNFSTGERGATCAECFLGLGYAVVFLHRAGSIAPFTRNFRKKLSSNVDSKLMSKIAHKDGELVLDVDDCTHALLREELDCFHLADREKFFMSISFKTVSEYLDILMLSAMKLARFNGRLCVFLAAAVSDFFIPQDKMVEHKIQSSQGLILNLDQVPKLLSKLTEEWAPRSYVVSFKLETDEDMLIKKAKAAIDQYHVQLVVANLLQSRRDFCYLVSPKTTAVGYDVVAVHRPDLHDCIEPSLVQHVVEHHLTFARGTGSVAKGLAHGISSSDIYCSWAATEAVSPVPKGRSAADEEGDSQEEAALRVAKAVSAYVVRNNEAAANCSLNSELVNHTPPLPPAEPSHKGDRYREIMLGVLFSFAAYALGKLST